MTDVVDTATRSKMMSGIRGKDTRPELLIRKALFQKGFRYRLHDRTLPGRPDLVFHKYRAVIFVNGCFWHQHRCHLFKWPSSRKEFWKEKLNANRQRDCRNIQGLRKAGWRVLVIWECAVKGKKDEALDLVITRATRWLRKGKPALNIAGSPTPKRKSDRSD